MPLDPDHPWIFHRNEVDILEEDVDEIYRLYGGKDVGEDEVFDPATRTMEERLIQEQIDAEDYSEAEFSRNANPMWLLESAAHDCASHSEPEMSIRAELSLDAKRPPFYAHTLAWAEAVFNFAKSEYERGSSFADQAFRIYLNVKMVPIKLSVAMQEEMLDDPLAEAIAEKEYAMALLYLNRVLESMLVLNEFEQRSFDSELHAGIHIRKTVKELIARLKRRRERNDPATTP